MPDIEIVDLVIKILVVIFVVALVDGLRRKFFTSGNKVKIKLDKSMQGLGGTDEDYFSSELPTGGARTLPREGYAPSISPKRVSNTKLQSTQSLVKERVGSRQPPVLLDTVDVPEEQILHVDVTADSDTLPAPLIDEAYDANASTSQDTELDSFKTIEEDSDMEYTTITQHKVVHPEDHEALIAGLSSSEIDISSIKDVRASEDDWDDDGWEELEDYDPEEEEDEEDEEDWEDDYDDEEDDQYDHDDYDEDEDEDRYDEEDYEEDYEEDQEDDEDLYEDDFDFEDDEDDEDDDQDDDYTDEDLYAQDQTSQLDAVQVIGGDFYDDGRKEPVFGDNDLEFTSSQKSARKSSPRKISKKTNNNQGSLFEDEVSPSKTAPVVEEVIVINAMAPKGEAIHGAELLTILKKSGMRLGAMNIFHKQASEGTMFSLANMLKPGTFDMNSMEDFETVGVSLFVQLPNNNGNMASYQAMLELAETLRVTLGLELKDENRARLTTQILEHQRQQIRDFELKKLSQLRQ
jgi:cell division protein ZipA